MTRSFDIRPRSGKKIVIVRKAPRIKSAKSANPARKATLKQKTLAGTITLAAIAALLLAFLVLPEARIKVAARTEPVTRDFEIEVNQNENTANPAELAVPARIVTEEVEDKKTFPSTGVKNVGRKASGFIYIYNFSKTTLILRAGTTILTAGDRKYYFTQDVTGIRPTAFIGLQDQEIDETSLIPPVPVVAALPGEVYNLAKGSRLEIQNEVFGKQPKSLYAVAAEDLSGGTTKEVKYVTPDDIAKAGNGLAAELIERELKKLSAASESAASEVLEKKALVPASTETPEFEVSAKVKIQALVYEEADVRDIIIQRIERLLPKNKSLKKDGAFRLGSKFISISIPDGKGVLATHFEGEIIYSLDTAQLTEKVKGKTAEEIREILLSRPEIASVDIKFYPSWVKKAPKFGSKIFLQTVQN